MDHKNKVIVLDAPKNAFLDLLTELGGGRVVLDLAEKMPTVIEAVKRTGKKATLTLVLTVKPDGKGEVQTVDIADDIKTKLPERDRRPTTFFITGDHDLSRTDPKQTDFKFPEQAKVAGA